MNIEKSLKYRNFLRKYAVLLVLIVMIIIMSIVSPTFRTLKNAENILRQVSVNGILAIGMTLVIMTGGIDLTVGPLVAVSGVVAGSILVVNPDNIFLAIFASIIICGLFGLANGVFISKFSVPPFIATLAGQTIARGFSYVYSNGKPYTLSSDKFRVFGRYSVPIFIFLILLILFHIILSHTKFGRYIYATGGNRIASDASGIKTKSVLIKVYTIAGILSSIAGIVLASRTNSGQPAVGVGYEVDAIAAAVIGGTSMSGGVGTIKGTLIGILIIGVMNNGLNLLDVSSYYQQIIKGLIILGAVIFDNRSKEKS